MRGFPFGFSFRTSGFYKFQISYLLRKVITKSSISTYFRMRMSNTHFSRRRRLVVSQVSSDSVSNSVLRANILFCVPFLESSAISVLPEHSSHQPRNSAKLVVMVGKAGKSWTPFFGRLWVLFSDAGRWPHLLRRYYANGYYL